MSALKMALATACICWLPLLGAAQQMDRVQAVVDGIDSPQHAAQANQALTPFTGVVMSRLDHATKNLFMLVRGDCPLDLAALRELLLPFGMTVRCYRRQDDRESPFRHLDPSDCEEPTLLDR